MQPHRAVAVMLSMCLACLMTNIQCYIHHFCNGCWLCSMGKSVDSEVYFCICLFLYIALPL